MSFDRREFLGMAGLGSAAFLSGCSGGASSAFPGHDINFLIPYGPGGGFDSYVRVVIGPMQRALPRHVNVLPMNVEGAGGAKACNQLYHAKPDGYNICAIGVVGAIVLQLIQGKTGFDLEKMTWIGTMGRDPSGIAVGANSPIRTLADLQALSKQRPVKFTSTGPGSPARASTLIASELLGINAQVIAGYKGTNECLVAAARGDGDATVSSLASMQGLVKAGVIRTIASFEEKGTIPGIPDATALGKPDLANLAEIRSVAAPPGLPGNVRSTLAEALHKALLSPEVQSWAKKNGNTITASSPEETLAIIREQTAFIAKWKHILGDRL